MRVLIAIVALFATDLLAQERTLRFPLPADAVMRTLQRAGLSVDSAHLQMPQNLTATSTKPSLQITGAELLSDGHLRVRLACENLAQCQPFFVNTAGDAHGTELMTLASLRSTSPNLHQVRPVNNAVLKVGEEVQMLLADERMRISIPVVSIDTGSIGAEVRVTSLDHKQTFHAFVVNAELVRAVLP